MGMGKGSRSRKTAKRGQLPFGFSRQQAARLQHILDTDGRRPADLAEEWGVSISAARHDVARMRAKAEARTMAELLSKAQHAGLISIRPESDRTPTRSRRLRLLIATCGGKAR